MSIFDRLIQRNPAADREKQRERLLAGLREQLRTNVREDAADVPALAGDASAFLPLLDQALRLRAAGLDGGTPADAEARFWLSEDRMRAYACLLPPLDGGRDLDLPGFLESLRYEGVCHGVLDGAAAELVSRKGYLHICLIAEGEPPVDGVDGEVTDFFERRAIPRLEVPEEAVVDFRSASALHPVHSGEIICQIRPPVPGRPGRDVTGRPIPCRKNGDPAEVPAGRNTVVTAEGRLVAGIDGVVSMEAGAFCVSPRQIIPGDVEGPEQKVTATGSLYIGGSVSGGASVEAAGDIFICGAVQDARVCSTGGSIRVQQGIRGAAWVGAARQLQAAVIEGATAEAGEGVFAEVAADSAVTSGGGVYVLGGRGHILGGSIRAKSRVAAKRIGNLSGTRTQITLGYTPQLHQDLTQTEAELAETDATLEKLRKSVADLRAAGELLSLDKRALLAQLTEQKDLYEEKHEALSRQRKALRQELRRQSSGSITCQELYPVVHVRIGDREAELTGRETGANIHFYAGQIMVK